MPGITISDARMTDIGALAALETASFQADRLSPRSFRRLAGSASAALRVARVGGELAGYCILLFRAGSTVARLYSLAVDPGHRGGGLAGRLVRDAERIARRRGRERPSPRGPRRQSQRRPALQAARLSDLRPLSALLCRRGGCAPLREMPRPSPGARGEQPDEDRSPRDAGVPANPMPIGRRRLASSAFRGREASCRVALVMTARVEPPPVPTIPAVQGTLRHGRLGHSGRHAEGFSERRHAAQGHHHQGLSRALQSLPRHAAEDHQSVALLRLSEPRLLLLAARRGARPSRHPSVETMVDLGARQLYAQALPELDDALAKALAAADDKTVPHAHPRPISAPSRTDRFDRFGRLLFDWFRCPVLEVTVENGGRPQIKRLAAVPVTKLSPAELALLPRGAARPHHAANGARRRTRAAPRYLLRRPLRSEREAAAVQHQARSSTGRASPRSSASRSSRSPAATSPGSPSSTRCSSARRRRSTITPTASPAAPCRRACRSSTIRSR